MRHWLTTRWQVCALLLLAPAVTASAALEPYFSEYVEGTSNNRALEVYNATGYPINLGGYKIEIYFDGFSTAGASLTLYPVNVANGGVFVVVNTLATAALYGLANQVWAGMSFDGNDALVLRKIADNSIVDVIGQIGFNPGAAWGSGLTSTQDHTLRRKIGVCTGHVNGSDPFDPAVEWDGYAVDTFAGVGYHVSNCEPVPFSPETWGAVKGLFR
jgi:hypothetical protein